MLGNSWAHNGKEKAPWMAPEGCAGVCVSLNQFEASCKGVAYQVQGCYLRVGQLAVVLPCVPQHGVNLCCGNREGFIRRQRRAVVEQFGGQRADFLKQSHYEAPQMLLRRPPRRGVLCMVVCPVVGAARRQPRLLLLA